MLFFASYFETGYLTTLSFPVHKDDVVVSVKLSDPIFFWLCLYCFFSIFRSHKFHY